MAGERFFIASGCSIATTSLYRCVHLREQLERLGCEPHVVDWSHDSEIDGAQIDSADVVVLYRVTMTPRLAAVIDRARGAGKTVLFDTDDLVFEPDLLDWHRAVQKLTPAEREQHARGVAGYLETLTACDAALVATPVLAELVARRGKLVFVHRNALGDEMRAHAEQLYAQRKPRAQRDRLIIGYGSGTATHDFDFREAATAVAQTLERFPHVELWIAGPLELPRELETFGERLRRFPLADWRGWFELQSQFDLAIAPLERENIFCRAKSEIKFVEAGALGVPTVATRIDSFQDTIAPGENGLLAGNETEWRDALALLISDAGTRERIGESARRAVLARYSPEVRAQELGAILRQLATMRG